MVNELTDGGEKLMYRLLWRSEFVLIPQKQLHLFAVDVVAEIKNKM